MGEGTRMVRKDRRRQTPPQTVPEMDESREIPTPAATVPFVLHRTPAGAGGAGASPAPLGASGRRN